MKLYLVTEQCMFYKPGDIIVRLPYARGVDKERFIWVAGKDQQHIFTKNMTIVSKWKGDGSAIEKHKCTYIGRL